MSKRAPLLLLEDMVLASQKITAYTNDQTFESFAGNAMVVDAVVRNFEILGEAASKMPHAFTAVNPQIPWRQIKDYRNRLIHEYFGTDPHLLWALRSREIPRLTDLLEFLIAQPD